MQVHIDGSDLSFTQPARSLGELVWCHGDYWHVSGAVFDLNLGRWDFTLARGIAGSWQTITADEATLAAEATKEPQ